MNSSIDHSSKTTGSSGQPVTGRLQRLIIPPAAGWRLKSRALVSSGLFWPLISLILTFTLLGICSVLMLVFKESIAFLYLAQIILLFFGVSLIGVILYRIHVVLMQPLAHLRNWAMRMRGGNLAARIPVRGNGEFPDLARDINSLSEELMQLSRQMDEKVNQQTVRIAQKNRSLEILYDVAASINIARSLDDLLVRFLKILNDVVHARSSTLRLMNEEGSLRLVASLGFSEKDIKLEQDVPVERCICGKSISGGELLLQENIKQCLSDEVQSLFNGQDIEMIAVPLQYQGNTLGVYNLLVEKSGLLEREGLKDLLISIGRHMGMAIEKSRLDEESKRMSIIQERNLLSSELHDSLAQTLASLRFQTSMLSDSLQTADIPTAMREVGQIRNGLDEAYTELRELIAHFRAPFDERGLIPSIRKAMDRLRKESNILVFLQNEWYDLKLPSTMEMQILRIVQEALANIRKHSQAHAVRILMREEPDESYLLLIEDDGVGIGGPILDGSPGEHVGLSIMQERALRIGGQLQIESELGEGTQITLTFKRPEDVQRNLLDIL